MINNLFSPTEIRKLKKEIENQKNYCNKEEVRHFDGLYKTLNSIEKKNTSNHYHTPKTFK